MNLQYMATGNFGAILQWVGASTLGLLLLCALGVWAESGKTAEEKRAKKRAFKAKQKRIKEKYKKVA